MTRLKKWIKETQEDLKKMQDEDIAKDREIAILAFKEINDEIKIIQEKYGFEVFPVKEITINNKVFFNNGSEYYDEPK